MVFRFFYFFGHFWPLGGLWGVLGVPNNSWGPPRATMSSLFSRDTLPQGSVPKNGPWLLLRLRFFNFFTLKVIFSHFWTLGGRNSEGPFQIFLVVGVVPTRELWPYESILDFARAGNHIRTWGAPPLCPSVMAVVMRFNGAEKNYTFLYMHNFQTNWARKSRLGRIGPVFNLLKNLTNRDFLAWIV